MWEKLRLFKVRLKQLARNPRRDSYELARSCPVLPGLARSCPVLPGLARSGVFFKSFYIFIVQAVCMSERAIVLTKLKLDRISIEGHHSQNHKIAVAHSLCILAIRFRKETPLKIWFWGGSVFWPELLGANGSEIRRIRHFDHYFQRFSIFTNLWK